MLLLLICFIAGILTILAPCVLPLLPVIIGGSISSKKREKARPYIIAASLALSIIFFTLILKVSTLLINLSPDVLSDISGGLLIALGLVAIFPELWELLVIRVNWQAASQQFLGKGEKNRSKYIGPILIGIALGPVFASCSPTYAFILASVLPHSFVSGLIYLITYSIGLVLALLVVSLTGRKAISRYSWAVDTHSLFRRLIGVIFILIGIAIITGQEIKIETWVGNHLPFDETRIERVLLQKQHKSTLVHSIALRGNVLNVQATQAPQFVGLTNWINSKPTTLDQLKGQVVLVDFWTYSCINCIRSLPYVEKWYQTYHDKGFTVIGVSTPEFAFEHNPANVAAAVKRDGLTYPVALDNNYDTWNAYDNDSWPADYLIDKNGDIRYVSLGEGNYNVTEEAIQTLLGINQPLKTPKSVVPISQNQTSETYFGTNREQNYTGLPNLVDGLSNYSEASSLGSNQWSLGGSWQINSQSITSESASSVLTFNVTARNVYMVAGDQNNNTQNVEVTLPPHVTNLVDSSGAAAVNGSISVPVSGSNIYNIARLSKFGTTTVTLTVPAGVSLYTFTFGS
jgi:cytochrome c biogenesis protein CcdA/thiol-disulfide isomerase/thioredoxin